MIMGSFDRHRIATETVRDHEVVLLGVGAEGTR
jgi:hypothetical protein